MAAITVAVRHSVMEGNLAPFSDAGRGRVPLKVKVFHWAASV